MDPETEPAMGMSGGTVFPTEGTAWAKALRQEVSPCRRDRMKARAVAGSIQYAHIGEHQ